MHIAVFVAGNNSPSNSNRLADEFIEGMKQTEGLSFEKIQLKELALEHFSLQNYETNSEEDYKRVRGLIESASGIVIASPIWNFSVPSHLKNFIDRIGAFCLDKETHSKGQLGGKPVYFIYTGGAPKIAWEALMNLTTLHVSEAFKYYNATVVGRYFEPKCTPGRGVFGMVVDKRPESLARVKAEGKRFAEVTKHFATAGTLPLRQRLGHSLFTFLYRVGNRIMYELGKRQ